MISVQNGNTKRKGPDHPIRAFPRAERNDVVTETVFLGQYPAACPLPTNCIVPTRTMANSRSDAALGHVAKIFTVDIGVGGTQNQADLLCPAIPLRPEKTVKFWIPTKTCYSNPD